MCVSVPFIACALMVVWLYQLLVQPWALSCCYCSADLLLGLSLHLVPVLVESWINCCATLCYLSGFCVCCWLCGLFARFFLLLFCLGCCLVIVFYNWAW
jgi:hypothetical protein